MIKVNLDLFIKLLGVLTTIMSLVVFLILRIMKTSKRITQHEEDCKNEKKIVRSKFDAMKKEIKIVDERHKTLHEERKLQILRIEAIMEGFKKSNSEQHGLFFKKIDEVNENISEVAEGISNINGYLEAKEGKQPVKKRK